MNPVLAKTQGGNPSLREAEVSFRLSGRIAELDGIRGLAIGMVLIYHYFLIRIDVPVRSAAAYALSTGRLAWSGVDLFFVLSGFLIGGILLEARGSVNYFRVFYTRRFFRIVPIYAVLLSACYVVHTLVRLGVGGRIASLTQGELPWIPHLLFLQNFWMAWRNTLGAPALSVTWSLAVEEQFYLTLPLIVWALSPRRLVIFLGAGALSAPILRFALHTLWPGHVWAWFTLMPCRADSLLLGVLGAVIIRDSACRAWLEEHRRLMRWVLLVLVMGIAVLTKYSAGFFDTTGTLIVTVGFTWLAAFYLCVLMYSLLWRDSVLSRCLRWSWLCWLGAIAYGTYLLHELIEGLAYGLIWSRPPLILSVPNFGVSLLALGVTLVICRASWILFERPLVKIGHRAQYKFARHSNSIRVSAVPVGES